MRQRYATSSEGLRSASLPAAICSDFAATRQGGLLHLSEFSHCRPIAVQAAPVARAEGAMIAKPDNRKRRVGGRATEMPSLPRPGGAHLSGVSDAAARRVPTVLRNFAKDKHATREIL